MLTAVGVFSASAQAPTPVLRGLVRFEDRSLCSYNNLFFSKWVFATFEQVDANGVRIGPARVIAGSQLGLYEMPVTTPDTPGKLRVTCDNLVFEHTLTPADIAAGQLDVVLPNSKPAASGITLRFNGLTVQGVPGGSTVTAGIQASDPNADALHFLWGASDGTVSGADAPQATWVLPASRGLHFLYVLVSDGKGGLEERQVAISTDAGVVPVGGPLRTFLPGIATAGAAIQPQALVPAVPAPAVAAALKPSDHTPTSAHFLTTHAQHNTLTGFWGVGGMLDDRISSCQYYRDIGAVGGCAEGGVPTGAQLTFAQWKSDWGFGTPGTNEVSATYANLADLNLQRDMHILSRPGPRAGGGTGTDVASYVCNYPNTEPTLSNVRLGNKLVACVVFEFSTGTNPANGQPWNQGAPFTKYLTFGPTGNLLFSVNLDGRGEKFMPGVCTACHSGSYFGRYGSVNTDPAFYTQFVPFDLENYGFADLPGLRRVDQEAKFKALNQFILDTAPRVAMKELIDGWYATPNGEFNGSFVPPGWAGHEKLYLDVVRPSCRMCHIVLTDTSALAFNNYADFAGWRSNIAQLVCGKYEPTNPSAYWLPYTMPNARQTFERFWQGTGAPNAPNQPAELLQFLQAEGTPAATACDLPSWLP